MVENLTDKNLQLEEELGQLTETVNDLVRGLELCTHGQWVGR